MVIYGKGCFDIVFMCILSQKAKHCSANKYALVMFSARSNYDNATGDHMEDWSIAQLTCS